MTPEDYKSELLSNEFDAMHFGFSPRGFTDSVYNCAVDAWSYVVDNIIMSEPFIKAAPNKKQLKVKMVDLLFTTGGNAFNKLMAEFTHYTSRYIFRIPPSVTLPIHEEAQKLNAEELATGVPYSFSQNEKEARIIEKAIVEKKHALVELERRCKEADEAIILMEKMQKILEDRQLKTAIEQ